MTIIDEILESDFFIDNPPVLLDIGASGAIHPKWQPLARHSICIAFDADDREIGYAATASKGYKKLYLFNSLVSDGATVDTDFFLTKFPLCSSLLEPDHQSLAQYNFGDLFELDRVVRLKTVHLKDALKAAGVAKIDWFKTDSQGTDLRLFISLGNELIRQTLIAEFEPGIVDAYKGEDKLHALMRFMDNQPFWMNDIHIKGPQRISQEALRRCFQDHTGQIRETLSLKTSPCWAEVSYFNTFDLEAVWLCQRDYLLGWIFALIEGQYGFGLDIALQGGKRFGTAVFEQLAEYSVDLVTRVS
jgi:hypothetical protein